MLYIRIDIHHLCLASIEKFAMADFEENAEDMVGRLEKRRVATESGGDEIGGPGDETGDKTAVRAGDERDGGDWWGNVCGRRSV